MKTQLAVGVKSLISAFCLYVMSMDVEFIMSVTAFVVILVSNYARFTAQVKLWYFKIKKLFKK